MIIADDLVSLRPSRAIFSGGHDLLHDRCRAPLALVCSSHPAFIPKPLREAVVRLHARVPGRARAMAAELGAHLSADSRVQGAPPELERANAASAGVSVSAMRGQDQRERPVRLARQLPLPRAFTRDQVLRRRAEIEAIEEVDELLHEQAVPLEFVHDRCASLGTS